MIKLKTYPQFINDKQLTEELQVAGITINPVTPYIDSDKNLVIDVIEGDADIVKSIVSAHKRQPKPEPTIADKLASVGLSLDELKAAILGGN